MHNSLIYDWNVTQPCSTKRKIEINDETLRDGLQACGITIPGQKSKLQIVKLIDELNIDSACIGYPASSAANFNDVDQIIQYHKDHLLNVSLSCAARTNESDLIPIIELSEKHQIRLDANIFIASSPIRQYVEGWDIKDILDKIKRTLSFAQQHNIPICFITEDTTRSKWKDIETIYLTALEYGAYRICICDTVGHATARGVVNIVGSIRELLNKNRSNALIDWHGHNDKGLALACALVAIEAGADRIHATGLGIGERSGNTSMEQLIINLMQMGLVNQLNVGKIKEYCQTISNAFNYDIPINLPIVGKKVFATASGIHADAVIKGKQKDDDIADIVYSSIPASQVGRQQLIEIGPISGKANVAFWLEKNNLKNDTLIPKILDYAKKKRTILSNHEIWRLIQNDNSALVHADEKNTVGSIPPLINECNDKYLEKFLNKRTELMEYIKGKDQISIGTLGPEGTTSYSALVDFQSYLRNLNDTINQSIRLWNNFDLVHKNLLDHNVDMIIIPNTYSNITEMYWEQEIRVIYSFFLDTPPYGLVGPKDKPIEAKKGFIKIACCKPVFCLKDSVIDNLPLQNGACKLIEAYSTVESVEFVKDGKADYAITSATSIEGTDLKFVAPGFVAQILWTVFAHK